MNIVLCEYRKIKSYLDDEAFPFFEKYNYLKFVLVFYVLDGVIF